MGKRRRYFRPASTATSSTPGKRKDPSPARRVALSMLIHAQGPRAQGMEETLENARRRGELNALDAALAQEIARGVCRQRRWLEEVLARYLHHPLPRQAAQVHEALLIGIYQALFLDRIPAHTIVDETVRLVGTTRTEASYRSLANAVMRRVVSESRESLLPGDDQPWLVLCSIPEWLASEAGQVLRNGQARAFFEASNRQAPLHLRVAGLHDQIDLAAAEEALRGEIIDQTNAVPTIERGRFLPDCFQVTGRGIAPDQLPSFRRGLLTVEDEGAQVVGALAGARPGMRILDFCASPGGKTAHMLDLAGRQVQRLVASDVSQPKIKRLEDTLRRLGVLDLVERRLVPDLDQPEFAGAFDLVLVDAPCSALGTLRRHPEVRWRGSVTAIRSVARDQATILDRAAGFVRPGGVLVYSVCTFTQRETDEVADRFLASHAGQFEPAPAPEGLPFDGQQFSAGEGRWRTLTHRDGCDTFFIARFRRTLNP